MGSPSRVRTEAPMPLLLTTNSLVVLPLAHMLASTMMLRALLMPTLPAAKRTAVLMVLTWMPLVRARLALVLTQWDLRIASLPRPRARAWERVPRALILLALISLPLGTPTLSLRTLPSGLLGENKSHYSRLHPTRTIDNLCMLVMKKQTLFFQKK